MTRTVASRPKPRDLSHVIGAAASDANVFEHETRQAVDRLRAAIVQLYAEVDADPASPQEVSRAFGLNRNLSWKISRFITARDVRESLSMLPGPSGMRILLDALSAAGASPVSIAEAKRAADAIGFAVEKHLSDKPTLELALDGMASDSTERLELSRRLMFRGASGLWGIQAKTRIGAAVIMPSRVDPTSNDIAVVGGWHAIRRLRPNINWPVASRREWYEGPRTRESVREPLDETSTIPDLGLVDRLCTPGLPPITRVESPNGVDYVMDSGPVGNTGSGDLIFGYVYRHDVPRFAEGSEAVGEFGIPIGAPVEQLIYDIYAHRDVAYALGCHMIVFARAFAHGEHTQSAIARQSMLPIAGEIAPIPGSPPNPATIAFPRYPDAIALAFERLGADPKDFRAVRNTLKYPPLGSTITTRFDLPAPP